MSILIVLFLVLFVLRFYISYHKQNTVAISTTLSKHHDTEIWETSQKIVQTIEILKIHSMIFNKS